MENNPSETSSFIDIHNKVFRRKLERCIEEQYGRFLVSSISNAEENKVLFPKRHGALISMDFSKNGTNLVTVHTLGNVEVRCSLTGNVICRHRTINALPTCARFHPSSEDMVLIAEEKGTVGFLSPANDPNVFVQEHYDVNVIEFSPNGKYLSVGGRSTRIRIYDVETKKIVTVFSHESNIYPSPQDSLKFHTGRISSLKWNPLDINMLVSGNWDNTVKVWDIRDPSGSVVSMDGPNICGESVDVIGTKILIAAWERMDALTIWDIASGSKIRNIYVNNRAEGTGEDFYYAAHFWNDGLNSDGRYAITGGSGTKQVEVVDLLTNSLLYSWNEHKTVSCMASKGSKLAWGGFAQYLSLAEIHNPKEFIKPDPIEDATDEEDEDEMID